MQRIWNIFNRLTPVVVGALIGALPMNVHAVSETIESRMQGAQKVGSSTFSYLFWDIYTAELFSKSGRYLPEAPYALKLTYARAFEGAAIAERSVEEMRKHTRVGDAVAQDWLQTLSSIFPDVREGDSLTGFRDAEDHTQFLLNGASIGSVADQSFTEAFFRIWLADSLKSKTFYRELTGTQ